MPFRPLIVCAILFIGLATITSSCKKTCSNTHCRSYGYNTTLGAYTAEVCNNGNCYCPNGFEGDSCQILSALKFINPSPQWQVSDQCAQNGNVYYVTIYTNGNGGYYNVLTINNLFNNGSSVEADIISNASHQGINLNIPTQGQINGGTGFYQSPGNGSLGKITLSLDYVTNSGIETNCTVIMYQQ